MSDPIARRDAHGRRAPDGRPTSSARSSTTASRSASRCWPRATAAPRSASGRRRLLELVEVPGAQPAPGRTGLFHFALLLPDRRSLARWVAHAVRERVRLAGASDHFVSEAIYLSDPDQHGIEIYADRPRELWEGEVAARMGTDPLDLDGLLGELDDPETRAVRAPARRHDDGARPPAGLADPADHRVLPRRARASA